MSSAIEAAVYAQHAVEVAMLWVSRDVAVDDSAYDLPSITELDERIEANLDGLRMAGDSGWLACVAALKQAEAGEIFAASALAVERCDLKSIAALLDLASKSEAYTRGQVGALGWVSLDAVKRILPGLLDDSCPPALHYLGISACAAQRFDPGAALGYALVSEDLTLRASACRAAGELGRSDLTTELRRMWQNPDASIRFFAAWSGALLGDAEATNVLFAFAKEGGPFARAACRTAVRRADPATALSTVQALTRMDPRVGLAGAAALGDPAVVPWILDCMTTPELARAAGAALAAITGIDLTLSRFRGRAPKGFVSGPNDDPSDENVAMDPEHTSPWPIPEAIGAWWKTEAKRFSRGTRYIAGKAVSHEWLEEVLRSGSQPLRAAAAEELLIRRHRASLFPTTAPGARQEQALGNG